MVPVYLPTVAPAEAMRWSTPSEGWANLNTYSIFDDCSRIATTGCVVSNYRGEVLLSAWCLNLTAV